MRATSETLADRWSTSKMKSKFNIRLEVPSPQSIAENLNWRADAALRRAEEDQRNVRAEHDQARQRYAEDCALAERLSRDVAAGVSVPDELERALWAKRKSALVLEQFPPRVAAAEQAVADATIAAKAATLREASKRIRKLQADVVNAVIPVLEAAGAAEAALDQVCRTAGAPGGVEPALTWPQSIVDEVAAANAAAIVQGRR